MISIKLFGVLKGHMPSVDENGFWQLDAAGTTIDTVLESAGVHQTGLRYTVLVNRIRRTEDYVLSDGDVLTVMPLIAGG